MMPIVELPYRMVARALGWVNVGDTNAKKMKRTIAPTRAPTSGRPRSFCNGLRLATRSSVAGDLAWVWVMVMMILLAAGPALAGPASGLLADTLLGELQDVGRVGLVNDGRAGQDRLAAADA